LNPLRDVIAGQRVVVVDDTIVRGNTQQAIVAMLREAGAAEVHVRISSPPVAWPCFYGIDFATRAELIAGNLSAEEIRVSLGADSLGYVSLEGLIAATTLPKARLCCACFDGDYPLDVAAAEQGKHLLEDVAATPVAEIPVVEVPVAEGPEVARPKVASPVIAGTAVAGPARERS